MPRMHKFETMDGRRMMINADQVVAVEDRGRPREPGKRLMEFFHLRRCGG